MRSRAGAIYPLSWYFCHIQILLNLWSVSVFCALFLLITSFEISSSVYRLLIQLR
jgi:hypothetical protein